jgi:hypothetical protein
VLHESSFQSEDVGSFIAGGIAAQQGINLGGVSITIGRIDLEVELDFRMAGA